MPRLFERFFLLGLTVLFFSFFIPPARADFSEQRQVFLDAESAFRIGDYDKFRDLSARLKEYPLYPYLLFMDIQKNLGLEKEKQVLSFMKEWDGSPLSRQLRQSWLTYLAGNNHWSRLVRDYREPVPQSVQCSHARALIETGALENAWLEAEKLWLHGQSRPRECDPVFDAWRGHGMLTPELVRQRIELAVTQNQTRLAAYLKRYLPPGERQWVDLWLGLLKKPEGVLGTDWTKVDRRVAGKILTHAFRALIRRDTPEAAGVFDKLRAQQNLSDLNLSSIEQEIALFLALRRHPGAAERIDSLPRRLLTPALGEWRVRTALLRQEWKEVLSVWDRLDQSQKDTPRWSYWRARALEATGRDPEAFAIYRKISGRQNYFSLLAADRLKEPCTIAHNPLSAAAGDLLELERDPGIQRAMELFYLGRMLEARREWIHSLRGRSQPGMKAAAILAHRMGWHDRAIIAAADAGQFDDLHIRFPLSYPELIGKYAGKNALDPVMILALIRQESMFMADVRSPAGALGVMQIMPATGRRIASMAGERFQGPFVLLCPENNIRFGTFYLRKRLEELQENPVLASAAYNAGLSRVRGWLPEEGSLPADIWIENIPFLETRNYIEMVFTYMTIYRQRLGLEPWRFSDRMPDVFSEKAYLEKIGVAGPGTPRHSTPY